MAYHPEAREIGERVLAAGGNAADAFVAAVMAENVVAEGAASLAGSLAALVYTPSSAEDPVLYLDAGFDTPRDPEQRASPGRREKGLTTLVPGAPAGLAALWERFGSKPFKDLAEPAARLADEGVPVTNLMAGFIRWRKRTLRASEYGRRTFFQGRRALRPGELLRQPECARFLRRFAEEGPSYLYRGEWGRRFLERVQAEGGRLTGNDLSGYQPRWHPPHQVAYRDHVLYASSGSSYGGLWVLLALKTLEHTTLAAERPYWTDPAQLETMIRVARQVWSEPALMDTTSLADPERVISLLSTSHTAELWDRVRHKAAATPFGLGEPHSYQIMVRDGHGMLVNGTTTIEAAPWGDGLFVEGLPLSAGGVIPWGTRPGERRLSAFTVHLGSREHQMRFALGMISNSLVEAAFQVHVKLIDYRMSAVDAVSTPRFGTFPTARRGHAPAFHVDRNMLDPRVPSPVARRLRQAGIQVVQRAPTDTGLGAVLVLDGVGAVGLTVPVPYVTKPFQASS